MPREKTQPDEFAGIKLPHGWKRKLSGEPGRKDVSDAIRYAIAQTYGYEYVERKVGPPRTRYEVTIASALPKRDVVALLDSMDENVRLKSWSRASAADMVVVSVKNLDTGESTSKTQPGPDGRDRRPVVTLAGKIRRLIRKKIK